MVTRIQSKFVRTEFLFLLSRIKEVSLYLVTNTLNSSTVLCLMTILSCILEIQCLIYYRNGTIQVLSNAQILMQM